ncbi:MAG: FAD-dependent oxidoreductase [Betaproteobacteria bacterium]|nr:FAD-dependent oxidoreductase [Betaproteobacteria bacterium]
MAEMKTAAYICKGCELGSRLDAASLVKIATKEGKMNLVREHDFLCSADGVALIKNDIDNEGVTHVAICACSRRAKTEAFNFPANAVSRGNLREGVIWIRPDTDAARETTQEMAEDYVRMACAEVKAMKVPEGNQNTGGVKTLLVVGGGISGMTAALEASKAGYKVVLVEKTGALGGMTAKLYKRIPTREPFKAPEDNGIADLVAQIEADANIKVYLNATLAKTSGAPGRFKVEIAVESGSVATEDVGAIVQATGFTPYDMNKLPHLGGGQANVVDQAGLEALAKAANGGPIKRADGKEVKSVVFVQCAGQRDTSGEHLQYCSGHCCNTSIKQAMYFKDSNPDIDTVVLFTDLRTPGNGEDFYRSAQNKGVIFSKGVVSNVSANGGGCKVKFKDLILNEETETDADLVVLATGMVPTSGPDLDALSEATRAAEGGDEAAKEQVVQMKSKSVLNLDYRQGPDIPQFKHGFNDSHFICFPYETRRTAMYAAGPVRRPMDTVQAVEDATGAAMKAIQAMENAGLGKAAHPRAGDLSFPTARLEGCTQCKRCTVECPFGAIDEDEKRFPLFNESRCRRCGTCMGACPVRVISFENYSVNTVGAQIKAVDIPDEFSEKPRVLILACENDAYPALDMAGMNRYEYDAFVRVIPVRCLGSVNTIWITDALNSGYDGVMLMGCKHGEEYQCHFVKGSELGRYRMSKVYDTLKGMNLEEERLMDLEVAITDIETLPKKINDYAAKIVAMGASPFKGL